MKKTVTINISGIIFHIDEDAYDRLNRYMSRLKRHFSRMEGRDEIITDIESRIAELLQEKIVDNKQVITIGDIEDVVKMMGEPSEMDQDGEYEPVSEQGPAYRRPKRLFRDPDNRMIAGVSSGLSAYFNIDPVWIRLLFVISLFAGGAGVLVYIILWIVVPQAITTADKLEMRGEPVNISNIERSFRDEVNSVKETFNEFADGAKETFKKKSKGRQTVFDNLIDFLSSILRIFLKVVIVIIGLVLVTTGLGLIVGFTGASLGLSSFSFFDNGELISFSLTNLLDMIFPTRIAGILSVVSLVLLIGIPVIMMVYLGIRLIAGERAKVPYIGITAFAFWLAGLVMSVFAGASLGLDFRHSARVESTYEIFPHPGKTLYVKALPEKHDDNTYSRSTNEIFDGEWYVRFEGKDYELFAVPEFSTSRKSLNDKITLEVSAYAKGSGRDEAHDRARALIYPVVTNDSVISIPTYYYFPENAKIRAQYVSLKLRLPVGQIVHFDENMETFFDENPNYHYRREGFEGNTWIMTENGLKSYTENDEGSYDFQIEEEGHESLQLFSHAISMIAFRLIII
ncbi:MAG: PspC domain-containing protein [Bacteroidales bacterium]|nr:PspC domain-containing protein [Bacteroidales bacterium]